MKGKQICSNCGHAGMPVSVTKGSFAIELVLWICFLLPGLIYSLWRLTSKADCCARCGSAALVPTDTPRGRALAAQFPRTEADEAYDQQVADAAASRGHILIIAGAVVLLAIVIKGCN